MSEYTTTLPHTRVPTHKCPLRINQDDVATLLIWGRQSMRFGYELAGRQWWKEIEDGKWKMCEKSEVPTEILESKWICFGPT